MGGQRLGYVRVSSVDQNPDRQLDGIVLDRVFTDRASGKDTQRPQLAVLVQFAREGDTVVVHSMDRLARNLDDLRRLALAGPSLHVARPGRATGSRLEMPALAATTAVTA